MLFLTQQGENVYSKTELSQQTRQTPLTLFQHFVILDGNNSIKNKIVEARAIVSGETIRGNI